MIQKMLELEVDKIYEGVFHVLLYEEPGKLF